MILKHKKLVLELNNIDLLGRRFNGYDLLEHFSCHRDSKFYLRMLVNNRKPYSSKSKNLFPNSYLEEYDWIMQATERKLLGTKNQLSLAEQAIVNNKYYQKAKILHFHLYHNINLPIEFLTRIPKDKQIIIDIHDTYWLTDSKIPMLEVFNYTNQNATSLNAERKRVLESIDAHFVVHSPYIYRLFKSSDTTKNLKNVSLINFGIDTKTFRPLSRAKINSLKASLGIPLDNVVLFCRAQSNFKGIEYIKQALRDLHQTTQKITIISVVEIGLLDDLADKYQIIDYGVVYNNKILNELYNLCDIFLSPSTEESFGFMAAEAMACGKPVIVFDKTALPDTTNAPKIGVLSKRSSRDLRSHILNLIENPAERQRRGELGLAFVKKNYQTADYYRKYQALFRQLLSRPARKIKPSPKTPSTSEVNKFKRILPMLQSEIDHPKTDIPPNWKIPVIDYNDPGVQSLIYDFNTSCYQKLSITPKDVRYRYYLKRIIPEPVVKFTRTISAPIIKITPAPIKKQLKKIIRRS